jgi:hypothetical protein
MLGEIIASRDLAPTRLTAHSPIDSIIEVISSL